MASKYSNPFGHRTGVCTSPTHPACRSHAELAEDYPLLAELAKDRGLDILAVYGKRDLMDLFRCCEKTIRRWTNAGQLPNRRIPNRGRCLAGDVEGFLARTNEDQLSEDHK